MGDVAHVRYGFEGVIRCIGCIGVATGVDESMPTGEGRIAMVLLSSK
jgi:hypothetical protein